MTDFRKVIKFGRNSLIISLPKKWVDFSGIQAGDSVQVERFGHDLVISPELTGEEEVHEKTKTIHIDGDSFITMKRKIMTAYIFNYDVIIIRGKTVATLNKAIREMLHQLMALEIIEESSDRIIAKCFLNMADISITNITHKTDAVIKTMFKDVLLLLKDQKAFEGINIVKNISERDGDVNRMTTLIARTIRYYLENPRAKKSKEYEAGRILTEWDVSSKLEKIGDSIKRLARLVEELNSKQRKELFILLRDIEEHYSAVMKAYFKQDATSSYKLENKRVEMMERINTYQLSYDTDVAIARAVQKVYDLFIRINEMTYLVG